MNGKRKISEITENVAEENIELATHFKILSAMISNQMDDQTAITIGDQSSGKSSVINAIAGIDLLPQGVFTTTTFGVKVKAIRETGKLLALSSNEVTTPQGVRADPCNLTSDQPSTIRDQLRTLFSVRESCLSYDQIAEVTLRSPEIIPFTFYDFPGPRTFEERSKSESLLGGFRGCKRPTVLLTTKLGDDFDLLKRDTTEVVRQCEKHGNQVIVVVTHLDKIVNSLTKEALAKFLKSYKELKQQALLLKVELDVVIVQSGSAHGKEEATLDTNFADIKTQESKNIEKLVTALSEMQADEIPELGIDRLRYKLAQACLGKVDQDRLVKLERDLTLKLENITRELIKGKIENSSTSLMATILPNINPAIVAQDSAPELESLLLPLMWDKVDAIYSSRPMAMAARPTQVIGSVIEKSQGVVQLEKDQFQYNERMHYIEKLASVSQQAVDKMFNAYSNSLHITRVLSYMEDTPRAQKWFEGHLQNFFKNIRTSLVEKTQELIVFHKNLVCVQENERAVPSYVSMRKDMEKNELVAVFLPRFSQIVQNIVVMLLILFGQRVVNGFLEYMYKVLPSTENFMELDLSEVQKLEKDRDETERSLESIKKIRSDIRKLTGSPSKEGEDEQKEVLTDSSPKSSIVSTIFKAFTFGAKKQRTNEN